MDIRAIRAIIRHSMLMTGAAIMVSACSSAPKSMDSEAPPPQEVVVAEPVEAMESEPVPVESIRIKADYPQEYIVKKGDTLWGIASKFLNDPWYWPEIWYRNPQVENPHLIYPGDILTLIYVDGRPQIQLSRAAEGEDVIRRDTRESTKDGLNIVKLSPTARRTSRQAQIDTIPSDAIRQFLARPKVVTREEMDAAPYIVSSDDAHLLLATDNRIYIRGDLDKERVRYSVYRRGEAFTDPETNEILGYEVIYAGDARIDVYGNPATATLTSTNREVLIGDMLLDNDQSELSYLFYPKLPKQEIQGQIISLFDAISGVGNFQIVVINRGADAGVEVGHVLATYYRGGAARDKYLARKKFRRGEGDRLMVELPDERSGLMIIFRVFDRVSYGLIVESTRVIRRNDIVRNPR